MDMYTLSKYLKKKKNKTSQNYFLDAWGFKVMKFKFFYFNCGADKIFIKRFCGKLPLNVFAYQDV